MKRFNLLILILTLCFNSLMAQTDKNGLTDSDISEALEMLGVQIHKFDLGECNNELEFSIVCDEYSNQKLVKSDTLRSEHLNAYMMVATDPITNKKSMKKSFVKQLSAYSKLDNRDLVVKFKFPTGTLIENRKLNSDTDNSFFQIRQLRIIEWKSNTKVPVLLIASSWTDTDGNNRLCGTTRSIKEASPRYYIYSYLFHETE